jgi:hypothetical protein
MGGVVCKMEAVNADAYRDVSFAGEGNEEYSLMSV